MEVSNHSLFLLQQLNIQREFGFLCDCTVAIGNVYFKAHRAVLAAFSNYFKMIFIHQSSECIKIQPSDIQPDVFSYLLHIMYTGVGPKQPVDQDRLQEGIRFLHAHQLCRIGSEGGQDADAAKMSNLYGIQISSQSAKERLARGPGEPGSQAERPQTQPSLAVGPEAAFNRRPPRDHRGSSATSKEDVEASSSSLRIKLERIDGEAVAEPPADSPSPGQESFSLGHIEDGPPRALYCHFCGEHCGSCLGLSEHLGSHATGAPPFRVPLNAPQNSHLGETPQVGEGKEGPDERRLPRSPDKPEQLEAGSPEEAQRQCQAQTEEAQRQCQAQTEEASACLRGGRRRRMVCAICSLRFAQRTQLMDHRYTHTGKHGHCHRLCRQLILQVSQKLSQSPAHTQGKVSPGYTLHSQESIDSVSVE